MEEGRRGFECEQPTLTRSNAWAWLGVGMIRGGHEIVQSRGSTRQATKYDMKRGYRKEDRSQNQRGSIFETLPLRYCASFEGCVGFNKRACRLCLRFIGWVDTPADTPAGLAALATAAAAAIAVVAATGREAALDQGTAAPSHSLA